MKTHLEEHEITAAVADLDLEATTEEHLGSCVSCRRRVSAMRELIDARRRELEAEAPDWERQRREIMLQLPSTPMVRPFRHSLWTRPLLAIAAVLVAAVGLRALWTPAPPAAPESLPSCRWSRFWPRSTPCWPMTRSRVSSSSTRRWMMRSLKMVRRERAEVEAVMKKSLIIIVVLAVAGPLAANDFDLPPGKWWEDQRLVSRIGLTDEQQDQIREIVYQHARRMIDLKADVDKAGLDLVGTVDQQDFDPAPVRAAYARFPDRTSEARERALRDVAGSAADPDLRAMAEDSRRSSDGCNRCGRNSSSPGARGQGPQGERPRVSEPPLRALIFEVTAAMLIRMGLRFSNFGFPPEPCPES